mmetsp:Transcript_47477/g.113910  ORF Transcript_47477/g.113910 Transcript_47477/m.113910 type:complete len:221 (+) Transcript_47477:380-1042(+)
MVAPLTQMSTSTMAAVTCALNFPHMPQESPTATLRKVKPASTANARAGSGRTAGATNLCSRAGAPSRSTIIAPATPATCATTRTTPCISGSWPAATAPAVTDGLRCAPVPKASQTMRRKTVASTTGNVYCGSHSATDLPPHHALGLAAGAPPHSRSMESRMTACRTSLKTKEPHSSVHAPLPSRALSPAACHTSRSTSSDRALLPFFLADFFCGDPSGEL